MLERGEIDTRRDRVGTRSGDVCLGSKMGKLG